jgi:hypothetical protein
MKLYEITSVYEVIETALVEAADETEAREKYGKNKIIEVDKNIKGDITIQNVCEVVE